jgi:hypothetical protein
MFGVLILLIVKTIKMLKPVSFMIFTVFAVRLSAFTNALGKIGFIVSDGNHESMPISLICLIRKLY